MFNLPKPDYIKMDVDGAEDMIIQGMKKVLVNEKLRSINIEVTGNVSKHEAVLNKLKDYKFQLFQEHVHNNGSEFYTSDYYFLRKGSSSI